MSFPHHVELDTTLRYVDRLSDQNIPGYVALDVRLAWRPNPNLELAIVGRNLLASSHPEFDDALLVNNLRNEIARSVHGKVTWRF